MRRSAAATLVEKEAGTADGETLAFLAAAFERVILDDFRQMLTDRVREIESHVSAVDRAMPPCSGQVATEEVAEKIRVLRASVADLRASIGAPWQPQPNVSSRPRLAGGE